MIDEYLVKTEHETFRITNSFLSMSFNKDENERILKRDSCLKARVVGVKISTIDLHRRIIYGEVCNDR